MKTRHHIPSGKPLGLALLLISLLALLGQPAWAQPEALTQRVRGTVLDQYSEAPLVGATVVVRDSRREQGAITDAQGEFALEGVALGRVDVQVSFVGYHPRLLQNLSLASGKELVLTVALEERVVQTEEVVVRANAGKHETVNEMAVVSARSFSVEETERFAGSLGDPSRMVANYAGVMSVSDQRNDIIIRGNSPLGLLWRLDGFDIPNPNHFGALGTTGGPVSMLNNNLLANSDFFTGAFPAEYGNGLAGAFDLRMRAGNNQAREFVGQIGFNGFELGAEGPFSDSSRASYLVSYRYSTLAVFDALGINPGTGASVPEYQDLSFKLNFPRPKGRVSLFGIGGISDIRLHADEKEPDDFSFGVARTNTDFGARMAVAGLSWVRFLSADTRLEARLSGQAARSYTVLDSLDENLANPYPYFRSNLVDQKLGLALKLNHKRDAANNFSLGLNFDQFLVNYHDSVWLWQFARFVPIQATREPLGLLRAFGEWKHKFSEALVLYAGLHHQWMPLNGSWAVEPRLGLRWAFAPGHSLNIGYGHHSQTQPRMTYFQKHTDALGNTTDGGNRGLDFMRSRHLVAGYDALLGTAFRVKIEAYAQALRDIPVSALEPQFSMLNAGDFFALPNVDSLQNLGTGANRGLELTLERFFTGRYYWLATASLFDSKYTDYPGQERNTAFNGNFALNLLGGYELPLGQKYRVAANLRGVWAGGKRPVPIDLEASRAQGKEVLVWEDAYEQRLPDYLRADLRLSFKANGRRLNQEWALDLQNLTDHDNVFRQYYDLDSGEILTEYQQGFFPMFLYRVQF